MGRSGLAGLEIVALMRFMLDANAFILLLTGHSKLIERAEACSEGDLAISVIAFAEVALGSRRGKPPPRELIDELLHIIDVLPFDQVAAEEYSALPLKRGSYDRLIAAHAVATGLTLVTANLGDFADIPGLKVEDWTQ